MKKLSIEELKSTSGITNISDEEAQQIINTLERIAVLFYKLHMRYKEEGKTFSTRNDVTLKIEKGIKEQSNEITTERLQRDAA